MDIRQVQTMQFPAPTPAEIGRLREAKGIEVQVRENRLICVESCPVCKQKHLYMPGVSIGSCRKHQKQIFKIAKSEANESTL